MGRPDLRPGGRLLAVTLLLALACSPLPATFTFPDQEWEGSARLRGESLTVTAEHEASLIELVVAQPDVEQPWTQGEGAADRIEFTYVTDEQAVTQIDVIGFSWTVAAEGWEGEVFWPGERVAVAIER